MKFTKMHGAGNDYLYIDARKQDKDWPALSLSMSDRHKGVGSDGIILAMPSDRADLRMRMFNADGSEGEMCGNGIRCLVRFALDKGIVKGDSSAISVETLAGVLQVTPLLENGRMTRARVSMGAPILRPQDIPIDLPDQELVIDHPLQVNGHSFKITGVSMGNPHAVAFIEQDVDDVRLHDIGPLVEHHPLFPRRVNFEIVNVISKDHLKARVWERGSGLTMACGTGVCAVAVAARLHNLIEDKVTIAMPGGELSVEWPGQGEVILEGPVAEIFEGDWPDA